MKRIPIAIASPSDVKEERDAVPKLFVRWNDANQIATLHPKMWEFTAPELGGHPQVILNRKIIEESELLIAIFWSKLGTPTPNAKSGTVDEIHEFIAKKGAHRVMLYFCNRDIPRDCDVAQLAKLNEFRAEMGTKGLFHTYGTLDEFERDLYAHLDVKIEELLTGKLPIPAPAELSSVKKTPGEIYVDPQLEKPIDFGNTLAEIAQNFSARMLRFQAIDGVSATEKYYRLGSHVYTCVADCLDRQIMYAAGKIPAQSRVAVEKIATRLKCLASQIPGPKEDFRKYWIDGSELASALSAEVAHAARVGKWKS